MRHSKRCRTRVHRWSALVCLCAAGLTGCGASTPDVYPVSGSVTLDGQPLEGCTILFRPAQGSLATGVINGDGRFQLTTPGLGAGAVAGLHAVALAPPDKKFDVSSDELEFLPNPADAARQHNVPAKYLSFDTSGLTADVNADQGELQFALTTE
jgi:hypothetical protein